MRTRTPWHRFQVAFTGAFLTGVPISVSLSNYAQLQEELSERLGVDPTLGWDPQGAKWRNMPSYKYGGGGYSNIVPLVLIRREGEALERRIEDLERGRPELEQEWLAATTKGWRIQLRSAYIQMYDLGVGVVVGLYDVSTPIWLEPGRARRIVESLCRLRPNIDTGVQSPMSAAYKELARESADAFRRSASECSNGHRPEPWLAPMLDALPSDESTKHSISEYRPEGGGEWGRLLWLHPVYVLSVRRGGGKRLRRFGDPFRAAYSKTIDFPKGTFIPGIDWSVVVVRGNFAGQEVPLNLTALHWAYYALFMEMDRGLLATLDSNKWQQRHSLRALESEADRMFRLFMRVKDARARLDSALTDLSGGQLGVWHAIGEVTKFEELVASVEEKIKILQDLAEHRVQEAATTRARRAGGILSALTALTVVTVMIALFGNFFGSQADAAGHIELRVLLVLIAFLLAAVLFREGQRDSLVGDRWKGAVDQSDEQG